MAFANTVIEVLYISTFTFVNDDIIKCNFITFEFYVFSLLR